MLIIFIIIMLLVCMLFAKKYYFEQFEINPSIPKVIYLCYKTKNIPSYIIPNLKKLYPDYEIKLYDNNDCINFLKEHFMYSDC